MYIIIFISGFGFGFAWALTDFGALVAYRTLASAASGFFGLFAGVHLVPLSTEATEQR